MGNNPFNVINPNNPLNNNRVGQMKNMMNMFKNSNNPKYLFEQMAMRNPQMQPIVNAIRQGKNPNQLFEEICRSKGINPQDLVNLFKN